MFLLRRSSERGHANHGWLDTYYSFSFADYYDSNFMGFRTLRVINEDRIAGGGGFPPHPHRDMEIITYMVEGELAHEDSMGNREVIRRGEIQRMSAGTGVVHSEFNNSEVHPAHLLQIWIHTDKPGHRPGYEQKNFSAELENHPLVLAVSPDGKEGAVRINQDVRIFLGRMRPVESLTYEIPQGRHAWLQLVKGHLNVGPTQLKAGDGLAVSEEKAMDLTAHAPTEFLLFDLN